MAKCRFKFRLGTREWECPLEALPGEEYCYWHKEEEGKEPDDAKLRELKENEIYKVFLRKAKLSSKELQNAFFRFANLQGADLKRANLQDADLLGANLQGAELFDAKLQGVCLSFANLQGAVLFDAKLQGAVLENANLQGADLESANLQGADFSLVNLRGTNLFLANLEGANLFGVRTDSETRLDGANLTCANLHLSYLDETKTLRNAEFKSEKEINEIVADFLKRRNKDLAVLDVEKIERDDSEVVAELFEEGLVRYVSIKQIVFFDRKRRRVVRVPRNAENKIFQRLRKRRNSEEEKNYVEISELNNLIERNGLEKYLYEGSREKLKKLYETSYEVYNNLYYFYIQNGRLEEALRMHYRRHEVERKLLREQGWINCLRSWIFDFFILKLLTGYGVDFLRPLIALVIIFVCHLIFTCHFACHFWLMNELISQVLAAAESFMLALLIFTITYRVSR
ncbi:MAG: pentapeptide repeat-containing protein [Candidatus Methanospirare jalkutatii]|nr:pentapeptide repeat-containing protein [Candidatus Methanospirare jalkutatii]